MDTNERDWKLLTVRTTDTRTLADFSDDATYIHMCKIISACLDADIFARVACSCEILVKNRLEPARPAG